MDKIHGKNVTNLVILLKLRYIQKVLTKKFSKKQKKLWKKCGKFGYMGVKRLTKDIFINLKPCDGGVNHRFKSNV